MGMFVLKRHMQKYTEVKHHIVITNFKQFSSRKEGTKAHRTEYSVLFSLGETYNAHYTTMSSKFLDVLKKSMRLY